MGLNITFWNCQGIRSKRKELELYLNENSIDIIAFNETFLNKKVNFKIQGYDTIRNDRSSGSGGGVAFLVKHGLVVNKEFRNADFNIITDNEALAINLELSNNQNLTLATIYCPNGKPNLSLFQIYKQCVRPIFEYGSLSTITASDNIISKIQRLQNKFIRLALRLPKYIIPRLLHDSTGLPYVKDRLLTCATKSLDRIAQNPLVEASISSHRHNPGWDRFPTPLSVVRPGDS